jgi:hypothetical protein
LFNATLAELALHLTSLQYLGKANGSQFFLILCAAQSDVPTSGNFLALLVVLSRRHGCSVKGQIGKNQSNAKKLHMIPIVS